MSNLFFSLDLVRKPLIFNKLALVPTRVMSSSSNVLSIKHLKTKTLKRKKNRLTVVWKCEISFVEHLTVTKTYELH